MGLLRKKGKKKVEKSTKEKKDNTLIYKVLGGLTLLFSVFVFLASISYLFTWRSDQSILNSGISDFIFDFRNLVPQNFMGKLGAFLAHFFIYNGFGIGAFFIYPIFFIIGFNLYFNSKFRIRPKTTSKLMVTAIWVSLVCALLFSKTFPLLSGLLGYGVFLFSKSLVGTIGMVLILGLVTLFFLYVAFSIDVLESIKNKRILKTRPSSVIEDDDNSELDPEESLFAKDDIELPSSEDSAKIVEDDDLSFTVERPEEELSEEPTADPIVESKDESTSNSADDIAEEDDLELKIEDNPQ